MCLPLFARRKTSRLRFSVEFGQPKPKRYLKEVEVAEFECFQAREFAGRSGAGVQQLARKPVCSSPLAQRPTSSVSCGGNQEFVRVQA